MACLDCSQCENLGLVDICAESVTFGTATPSTEYTMKITDVTTGAIFIRTITTNEAGEVTLLLAGLYANFTVGRTMEIRIYTALTAFNEPVEMTNGETVADCFAFEFFRSVDLTPAE